MPERGRIRQVPKCVLNNVNEFFSKEHAHFAQPRKRRDNNLQLMKGATEPFFTKPAKQGPAGQRCIEKVKTSPSFSGFE